LNTMSHFKRANNVIRSSVRTYIKPTEPKYLVTGAQGFLGSWILKQLIQEGKPCVGIDLSTNKSILEQILTPAELLEVKLAHFSITDYDRLYDYIQHYEPSHIIHLAGAQIPTCKKNPSLGAQVNVVGTSNIFQCAKASSYVRSVVYASSAAVCGPWQDYDNKPVHDDDIHMPRTLYGVYKVANEGTAKYFFHEEGVPNIGFRPLTMFGVGREIGLTSDTTKAIKAAILGRYFDIGFWGPTVFNFCPDIADLFIKACPAVEENPGAYVANIKHCSGTVEEFVKILHELLPQSKRRVKISENAIPLPFPGEFTQNTIDSLIPNAKQTPLREAIEDTIEHFYSLQDAGKFHDRDVPAYKPQL